MYLFFFFNETATTEIYTLSLHDALPIYTSQSGRWFIDRARLGIENTSGKPHSMIVSSAPWIASETRVNWRTERRFSSTPCAATSEKNTNAAAAEQDTKIAGIWRSESVA